MKFFTNDFRHLSVSFLRSLTVRTCGHRSVTTPTFSTFAHSTRGDGSNVKPFRFYLVRLERIFDSALYLCACGHLNIPSRHDLVDARRRRSFLQSCTKRPPTRTTIRAPAALALAAATYRQRFGADGMTVRPSSGGKGKEIAT